MWLIKCSCVVLVLVKCSNSEDDKHEPDTSGSRNRRYGFYPNDFFPYRDVVGPGNLHSHEHHHHINYRSQGPPNFNHRYSRKAGPPSGGNTSGIPLDFAKKLNEHNISHILKHFVKNLPEASAQPQISNRFSGGSTENVERTSIQLAKYANCMPELQTVETVKTDLANIVYVPECTRIERCGGCCSHHLLSCQPVEKETVSVSVIKTEFRYDMLDYVSKEVVLLDKHTKCRCDCKVKAEDCKSYQEYIESECQCVCKNPDEEEKCHKIDRKYWNRLTCTCDCQFAELTYCSTGTVYDNNECKCVKIEPERKYVINGTVKELPDTQR